MPLPLPSPSILNDSWIPPVPAAVADLILPEPNTGCWLWLGALTLSCGYGRVTRSGFRNVTAHRLVYALCRHPEAVRGGRVCIARRLHVHHLCGLKSCCNPDHLRLVDSSLHASEHRRQEWREGRGWGARPRAVRVPRVDLRAKVGVDQIARIRSTEGVLSCAEVAAEVGISKSQAHRIRRGERWRQVIAAAEVQS